MKRSYLVNVQFTEGLYDDLIARIAQHGTVDGTVVNWPAEEGIITAYALSADRTKLWIVVQAESSQIVKDFVQKMPLYKHQKLSIHELAFHESLSSSIPQPSLN